ncbi:hypothetical protein EVJ58_g9400 [Rhodofomes roseus]|uniref:Uncharacterized protein n=1 Tax=Rhodofomes roseus TaxID=34475 RepID=A0A4Y9XTD8_9APHY|nr:hypothetical protein EVJ58_g9400 [Rhodofomes roseus]
MHPNSFYRQTAKHAKNGRQPAPLPTAVNASTPSPSTLTSLEASPQPEQNTTNSPRTVPGRPGSPSFADVTAGRSASPAANDGMPQTPRLAPSPNTDDIPPLDLGPAADAPTILAHGPPVQPVPQEDSSLLREAAQAAQPTPKEPLAAVHEEREDGSEWVEVRRNGRKRTAKHQTTGAGPGLVTPSDPLSTSPAPKANSDSANKKGDPRKRRRLSTEHALDGGESSLPQPSMRSQPSPGPSFARTVLQEPEHLYDITRPPVDPRYSYTLTQPPSHGPQPTLVPSTQPPPPQACHPSSAMDLDAAKASWRQVPSDTDLFWDPRIRRLAEEPGPPREAQSDIGSYADPEMDEIIRSIRSPPQEAPTALFDPPAVVMARMISGDPQPTSHLDSNHAGPPPIPSRPALPHVYAPVPTVADSSAFAAHWSTNTRPTVTTDQSERGRHLKAEAQRPNIENERSSQPRLTYRARYAGSPPPPIPTRNAYTPPTTPISGPSRVLPTGGPVNERSSPPRLPYRARYADPPPPPPVHKRNTDTPPPMAPFGGPSRAQLTGGPPRVRPEPNPPRDRAQSRASAVSYVSIPRNHESDPRQTPSHDDDDDDDAMDVDYAPPPNLAAPPFSRLPRPPPTQSTLHLAPPQGALPPLENADLAPLMEGQLEDMNPRTNSGIDWWNEDITQPPPLHWRPIQFTSIRDIFADQDLQQAHRWRRIAAQCRCLLVQIGGFVACDDSDPTSWQRYELLKEIIWVFFRVDREQLLAPQRAAGARTGRNVGPVYSLIQNVTKYQEEEMMRWYWLSTRWLSINFILFPTPLPTYIATWESATAFPSSRPEDAEAMMARGFRKNPLFACTIRTIRRDKDRGVAGKWGDTSVVDALEPCRSCPAENTRVWC